MLEALFLSMSNSQVEILAGERADRGTAIHCRSDDETTEAKRVKVAETNLRGDECISDHDR